MIVFAVGALTLSGCSPPEDGTRSETEAVGTGWSRVNVPVPRAAARMARIGNIGPKEFSFREEMLINFWASSCGPCRLEMPLLERLSRSGTRVIGVSRDNIQRYAQATIRSRSITFPNYSDASADVMFGLRHALYPNGIPTTVIVRDGRVRWVHIGPFNTYAELKSAVADRMTR